MNCPFCGDSLVQGKRAYCLDGVADLLRGTFLRVRVCGKCGSRVVLAEVPFPEDRQDEELKRLRKLRYAKRAKPTQHT